MLNMYISMRTLKQSKGALKQEKVDIVSLDIAKSLFPVINRQLSDDDRDSTSKDQYSGDDGVVVLEAMRMILIPMTMKDKFMKVMQEKRRRRRKRTFPTFCRP